MATQFTASSTPTPTSTDVFNTPLLKPDEKLATLEEKLAAATTKAERIAIQEQIDARRSAIMQETGFTNVGFGSSGYYLPGAGQGVGYEVLEPTGTPGVYQKSTIGTDTSVDPYGRQSVGVTGNKRTFYDAQGNELTPAQVAATKAGQDFAAAGWDIGFGAGSTGGATPLSNGGSTTAKNLSTGSFVSGNGSGNTAVNPLNTTVSDTAKAERTSAYNLLYNEFNRYGLGTLVSDIKNYLIDNTFDPSEFSIQLQNTPAYQKRFAANADRIKAGLGALKPAEYIALEDQYQNLMRNYGLPDTYYAKGDLGIQEGFNKLIASDVSPTELEDRIATAQSRVVNADPNVIKMLKSYYPDITNGDILAYTLDPKNAIDMIKRKVTAAEIGAVQYGAGLNTGVQGAEDLTKAGVSAAQYAQATPFITQAAERGSQLADIYGQTPYNQQAAEAEAFNLAGGAQAAQKRKKLSALEQAQFGGSSGVGALGRDKALYGSTYGQAGTF